MSSYLVNGALVPNPTAQERQALIRWFWRSAFSGYFGGWNTGMMSRDLAAIVNFHKNSNKNSVEELQFPYTALRLESWRERPFRTNNALSKVFALLMARQKPVDLLTGQKIDLEKALAWANESEFHHFFPKAYLRSKDPEATDVNSLANIILLTSASNKQIAKSPPSHYLKLVEAAAGAHFDDWLQSNLISGKALAAARADDFPGFLAARSDTLQAAMELATTQ